MVGYPELQAGSSFLEPVLRTWPARNRSACTVASTCFRETNRRVNDFSRRRERGDRKECSQEFKLFSKTFDK